MAAQIILLSFAIVGMLIVGHALGIGMVLFITKIQKKFKNRKQAKEVK